MSAVRLIIELFLAEIADYLSYRETSINTNNNFCIEIPRGTTPATLDGVSN